MKIEVYDPAMCCSTGVCGPSVDPQLVRFSADLEWLRSQGVTVERFNLAQQPGAFAQDAAAKAALMMGGDEVNLPLVKVDGKVKSSGVYPSRAELAEWAGVGAATSALFTDAVAELVAIGAAIASNCEPCFKYHYDKARKLGISKSDIRLAVDTAQAVKDTPARSVLALADKYLNSPPPQASACCDPAQSTAPGGKCCG
jgi:AhpD family alkylhydroperoxidase